jgi:uncharacterized SAM-binding protein YcdF (DUF218 family)
MVAQAVLIEARILWDYLRMGHALEKCGCILALGSHDLRVAERAAELYREGWAPYVVFSGGLGNLTLGVWTEPEADRFAAVARNLGVPDEAILIENRSTNTGENIRFTRKLLEERGLDPGSFLVVQKPYMERRGFATFHQNWPGQKVIVTSPQLGLEEYPSAEIPLEQVLHIMVGDLQRIRMYPEKGFQIAQEIPARVWEAYEAMVAMGFTGHLIR